MTKKPDSSCNTEPAAAPAPVAEFSRLVELAALPAGGVEREIEAEAAEREALARRFGLVALAALRAGLQISPIRSGAATGARVIGSLSARVTQICVVSLEPFETEVTESFRLDLLPADILDDAGDAGLYHDDEIEPLDGDVLDIGELVAQYLSLALDPHPRRPGISFEAAGEAPRESGEIGDAGPFAVLGDLRRKM